VTEEEVYKVIAEEGAVLEEFSLTNREALSILTPDGMFIAVDKDKIGTPEQWIVVTMHEAGHCATGSFYTEKFPFETRRRLEERADRWAIKKLVPEAELNEAVSKGITSPWELAEHFNVTEEFIRKAVEYYECRSLYAV